MKSSPLYYVNWQAISGKFNANQHGSECLAKKKEEKSQRWCQKWPLLLRSFLRLCRSCYMVFPSLQLSLALSCVMGLVMFARYCGEDHSEKLGTSSRDAVSFSVSSTDIVCFMFWETGIWFFFSCFFCFLDLQRLVRRMKVKFMQSYVKTLQGS